MESIVEWPMLKKYRNMTRRAQEELIETIKSDPEACNEFQKLVCKSVCSFVKTGDIFKRNIKYDKSVHDILRFKCSKDLGKVGIIIENQDRTKYLMVSSYNYKWSFPKGSIDPIDTSPKDAAYRELKEETGIPRGIPLIAVSTTDDHVTFDDDAIPLISPTGKPTYLYRIILNDRSYPIGELDDIDLEISKIGWVNKEDIHCEKIKTNFYTREIIRGINRDIIRVS